MPALNYAQAYSQALVQAYPYVLHFAALRSTENDSRYRWTGANTIQIPSLTTTAAWTPAGIPSGWPSATLTTPGSPRP